MVEEGAIADPKPDAVFGLHVFCASPSARSVPPRPPRPATC